MQRSFKRIKDIEQALEVVLYFNGTLNLVLDFLIVAKKKKKKDSKQINHISNQNLFGDIKKLIWIFFFFRPIS